MTTTDIRTIDGRNREIVTRAETGEDLTAIAADHGVSRERIRQIVAAHSTKTNEQIRAARRAARVAARRQSRAAMTARVVETATAHPAATLSELVALTGVRLPVVKAALDWTERERRTDEQHYPSSSDAEVLAEIKRVADLPGGEPLTGAFYNQHRTGGVSHARLLQRFGTWSAACEAAGVTSRGPNPGRVYSRRWSEQEMVGWVWTYLSTTQTPSYARFEEFLRTQSEAPSAQTIRNTLGSWVEMKRRAVEANMPAAI